MFFFESPPDAVAAAAEGAEDDFELEVCDFAAASAWFRSATSFRVHFAFSSMAILNRNT